MNLSDAKLAENLKQGENLLSFGALGISLRLVIAINQA
jgi:hypothetical protein